MSKSANEVGQRDYVNGELWKNNDVFCLVLTWAMTIAVVHTHTRKKVEWKKGAPISHFVMS